MEEFHYTLTENQVSVSTNFGPNPQQSLLDTLRCNIHFASRTANQYEDESHHNSYQNSTKKKKNMSN